MLQTYPWQPGVIKDDTTYAAKGYATDSDKIRWVRGKAESWPGWQLETDSVLEGACRQGKPWVSNAGQRYVALGTNQKLYVYTRNRLYDITPIAKVTSPVANNPLTTTAGSSIVTVVDSAHGAVVGTVVYISRATAVGGIQIGGTTGTYNPNPFQTILNSPLVIVSQPAHGMTLGDFVTIGAATAVGGITLNGLYAIDPYGPDFYSVQATNAATASASGGGAVATYATTKHYTVVEVVDANTYRIDVGTPAVSGATGGGAAAIIRYELNPGNRNGVGASGYGLGGYGEGPYGIFLGGSATSDPRIWCFSNWGEQLVTNVVNGSMYNWILNVSNRAVILANAPTQVLWHVVTAERAVMAMGCTANGGPFDPMLIRWSDIEDNTVWVPADTNNAGDTKIALGSRVVAGCNTQNGILCWTDTALYFIQFTGDVDGQYSANSLGEECGLIGPNAFVEESGSAYWISKSPYFFRWQGGVPQPVDSPMRQWFTDRLQSGQQSEIFAFYDSAAPAVTWLFAAAPSVECNEYVRVDLPAATQDPNAGWSNGTFDRTMWFDLGIFEQPLATSSDGHLYRQNIGTSDNGNAIARHVTLALLENADGGDRTIVLSRAVFDAEIASGTVQLMTEARKWPNGQPFVKGPFNTNDDNVYNDMRTKGRQITITVQSVGDNDRWRIGQPRYDVSGSTKR